MVNYAVDPAVLTPLVPSGTELDTHQGRTFLSVVAFRFLRTRLLGIPIPFHRNFEEMNLRFYVRRDVAGEVRRAVVFVKEIVPRRGIAALARAVYNEPYVALPMRSRVEGSPPIVDYGWRCAGRWQRLSARAVGPATLPESGSHEEFISDHLWGYTRQRDGGTIEYRVAHPSWQVWRATDFRLEADFNDLYGPTLAGTLKQPASVFIAAGSEVTVYRPRRLRLTQGAA